MKRGEGIKITKELLSDMYLVKQMKMKDIADFFGCSLSIISLRIKNLGIKSPTYSKYIDKEFGSLTVKSVVGKNKYRTVYRCECKCGKFKDVDSCSLITGNTISCGCAIKNKVYSKPRYRNDKKQGVNSSIWRGHGEIGLTYFSRLKLNSIKREFEFSITIEYIWNLFLLQSKRCKLTNLLLTPPIQQNKHTASLDRIDSSKGYIEGNVQWVHKDINFMKSDSEQKYFIELCKLVAQNN
jgi:hypothetical protein